MVQSLPDTELREKSQRLLQGRFRHVRAAALAAALMPLASVAVSPAIAQASGSGGTSGGTGGGAACVVDTAITSNFNGTRIAGGNVIWFNAVVSAQGTGGAPVSVTFSDESIQFQSGGTPYVVPVPVSIVNFSPGTTTATTVFPGFWQTSVPASGLAGKVFLGGVGFEVPAGGFPGGIKDVTWSGTMSTDTVGVTFSWQWAAAVYTQFDNNPNALGVKPVDDNKASVYLNSNHAGTPENFKSFVVGGARGGGGSNFTGSYSGTTSAVCP